MKCAGLCGRVRSNSAKSVQHADRTSLMGREKRQDFSLIAALLNTVTPAVGGLAIPDFSANHLELNVTPARRILRTESIVYHV